MTRIPCVALCLALTACSAPPSATSTTAPSQPEAHAPQTAPRVSSAVTTPIASHGLRASYAACIERADAVIPATQACIDDEAAYQQVRLHRALATANRGASAQVADLEYRQAAWQADTDANCAWDESTEGQQQRIETNMCSLTAIAARADELSR